MSKLLILFSLISSVLTGIVEFEHCGENQEKYGLSLEVDQCAGKVCTFFTGSSIHYKLTFTTDRDTKTLSTKIIGNMGGMQLTIQDNDACDRLECPLKKGNTYTLADTYKIGNMALSDVGIMATLSGDNGLAVCVQFKMNTVEKDEL